MGNADLGYLWPLMQLGLDVLGDESDEGHDGAFGLGEIDVNSPLELDDRDMEGYWVSMAVTSAFSAALDHVVTLHTVVVRGKVVTNHAMWTLLRGVLEPASAALWVLDGGSRKIRRERGLRLWHHDSTERGKWERDVGWTPTGSAKRGSERALQIVNLAKRLGLRESMIASQIAYSDTVTSAARSTGWDPDEARGLWREASAFAHGRSWVVLQRSSVENAERIRGGYGLSFTLDETRHRVVADLTHRILTRGLSTYADLAAAPAISDGEPDHRLP